MPSLSKETILVTGATSGFGKAIAEKCAADGARLIITGRRKARLEALVKTLGKKGKVHALCFDVRDRKATEQALKSLPKDFRNITALINNAGLALGIEPAQRASLAQWEQMVDTNIKGLMTITRLLLPGMVERGKGYIINIGSMAGHYPYPGGNAYGGTKAFVEQFSLGLRSDLVGTPVRVTHIAPGLAETEFSLVRLGDEKKAKDVYKGTEPLVAADIAEAVHWCLTRPAHVNVNSMEIMPTCQAPGPLLIHRS
jgi:3-hydroxy acid dehydrogenase / malonic semialdehyde reductase